MGDTTNRNVFTQVPGVWVKVGYNGLPQFSGGPLHSAAISSTLAMYGAGRNHMGQIGDSTKDINRLSMTPSAESVPEDGKTDEWEFVVCGDSSNMALKVVESVAATINDDEEPQVWRLE